MKIRKSVGAFIKNKKGKYLIIHSKKYWDIPKGGVEKGESLVQAIKRELKEELGIDRFGRIEDLNLSFYYDYPDKLKDELGFSGQKVQIFYVEYIGKDNEIKIDDKEIIGFMFLGKKEFLKKLSYNTTKKAFKKLLSSSS